MSNKLVFIRKETPIEGRNLEFYWENKTSTVSIFDSAYPNKKITRSLNPRKGKSDAVKYGVRIDGNANIRKSYYISETEIFKIKINNNLPYDDINWDFERFSFDDVTALNYIKREYLDKNLIPPTYNVLPLKNNTPEKAIFVLFATRLKTGVSGYNQMLEKLGASGDIAYRTHTGQHLRSYYEFLVFSILHFNNIDFEYEPENINGCIPDFKLKNFNLYLELVGYNKSSKSSHAVIYHDRLSTKKDKYSQVNLNVSYIEVFSDPFESIFENMSKALGVLQKPNIFVYFQKFALHGESYFEHLKSLAISYAKRKISGQELINKYQPEYNKIRDNHGSLYSFCESFMSMEELVLTDKTDGYFQDIENCKKWLNFYKKKYKNLPKLSSTLAKNEFCNLYTIYRIYGTNEFSKGGLFDGYVSFYSKKNKEILFTIDKKTKIKYDGIFEAYSQTNQTCTIGDFYTKIRRGNSDFIVTTSGTVIKNKNTGKIYDSIAKCCKDENINPSGFEQYLKRIRKGKSTKSKYSFLVPLTQNFMEVIDDKEYLNKVYEKKVKFNDDEVKKIHKMVKELKTEKKISEIIGDKFSRSIFYKSLIYQTKIKKFFNEEVNCKIINELYPPNNGRKNFRENEIIDIMSLGITKAKIKYNISNGTFYSIIKQKGKYKK